MDASEEKKFGKFVLPAWLALAWSGFWAIVDWLGRFQLLRDYWPSLKETAEKIAPPKVNVPIFVLSLVWILAFFFVIPPLARKWGPGKAIAGLMVSLGVVALVLVSCKGKMR